jgi:hypothetical protein
LLEIVWQWYWKHDLWYFREHCAKPTRFLKIKKLDFELIRYFYERSPRAEFKKARSTNSGYYYSGLWAQAEMDALRALAEVFQWSCKMVENTSELASAFPFPFQMESRSPNVSHKLERSLWVRRSL